MAAPSPGRIVEGNDLELPLDQHAEQQEGRQALLETRPSGVPSFWRNPETVNAGAITPTRTYRSAAGIYCREYQLTATADGRTGQAHGSACLLFGVCIRRRSAC